VYAFLRHYVELYIASDESVAAQRASFDAACESLDLILQIKRGFVSSSQGAVQLKHALVRHLELHKAAYGTGFIRAKHHWNLDVPEQIQKQGLVLDAFIIERIHLRIKRIADLIDNTQTYERSVLAGSVNVHIREAASFTRDGLRGKIGQWPGLPMVHVADRLEVAALKLAIGDFVFYGDDAGIVKACVQDEGVLMVLADTFEQISVLTPHAFEFRRSGVEAIWLAIHLEVAVAWYASENGNFFALRM
jgi:hypothetical protein